MQLKLLNFDGNRRSILLQDVPDNAVGNLSWGFEVVIVENEVELLHEVVAKMRKALREFCNNEANRR